MGPCDTHAYSDLLFHFLSDSSECERKQNSAYACKLLLGSPAGRVTIWRISFNGNPKLYSGWVDETLNMVLRTCARFAHRATFEVRVFTLFDLQGGMGLNELIFGVEPED